MDNIDHLRSKLNINFLKFERLFHTIKYVTHYLILNQFPFFITET